MKRIFKIDAALYPIGFLTVATGFGLHVAGHGDSQHVWVLWAYAHTLIAVVLVVLLAWHLLTHKPWLKALRRGVTTRKQRITLLLAVVAIAVMVSGIALLAVAGANTHVGLLHYRLGLLLTLLATGHAAKRLGILRKAMGK